MSLRPLHDCDLAQFALSHIPQIRFFESQRTTGIQRSTNTASNYRSNLWASYQLPQIICYPRMIRCSPKALRQPESLRGKSIRRQTFEAVTRILRGNSPELRAWEEFACARAQEVMKKYTRKHPNHQIATKKYARKCPTSTLKQQRSRRASTRM